MILEPYCGEGIKLSDLKIRIFENALYSEIFEPSVNTIKNVYERVPDICSRLKEVPTSDKLNVLKAIGEIWGDRNYERRLRLKQILPKTTGYHPKMAEFEISLIPEILQSEDLVNILDNPACFYGGKESLDNFIELKKGEYIKTEPLGSVFIIGSGNSVIPPLIALINSTLTNNFTILRPSFANYPGLYEIARSIEEAMKTTKSNGKEALKRLSEGLLIAYMEHESEAYDYLLKEANLGAVNFWGGGPALSIIKKKIAENPHNPRFIINGPMTGYAVLDYEYLQRNLEKASRDIAYNIALFDQKLCSSPTEAAYIGSLGDAKLFGESLAEMLENIEGEFPSQMSEAQAYKTQLIRRELHRNGATVFVPKGNLANWTVVVSNKRPITEDIVDDNFTFSIYERSRFLEVISVPDTIKAIDLIQYLPTRKCYKNIERVQTVGYAMDEQSAYNFARKLSGVGVYRIVPLGKMFIRNMLEPSDGEYLPRQFTFFSYMSK